MVKKAVAHKHNGVLAIKKNIFESVLMRWMILEPIIKSEVRQREKKYNNAYIWNLERW